MLRNGYLKPKRIVLGYVELNVLALLSELGVQLLEVFSQLLPQEFLIVYEDVQGRRLQEVNYTHYEHHQNTRREHDFHDFLGRTVELFVELGQNKNENGEDAEEPDEVAELHEDCVFEKAVFFSVDGVDLESYLHALDQYFVVFLLLHALLEIVFVESVPRQVTEALPWGIRFYNHSIRHTYRDPELFLHATEVKGSGYLIIWVTELRIPVLIKTLEIVIFV